ncbi:MAG: hypothetical protein IT365_04340 [Candidatus Hydrogenedentes bacterium]|nr:hypothetical protein [Candidatus Hydrogenedentota bacterium]
MSKILVLFIVFAIACVVMFKYLPIWASLLIVVIGIVGLRYGAKYFLKRLFLAPFKMKGKALAGATVSIHSVRPTAAPTSSPHTEIEMGEAEEGEEGEVEYREMVKAEEDEDAPDYGKYQWYLVDVTITPQQSSGDGFTHWEPGEVMLVSPTAKADDLDAEEDDLAMIHDLRIFQEGSFQQYDGEKFQGPLHVEFHAGVKPGVSELKFRYYFEILEPAVPFPQM